MHPPLCFIKQARQVMECFRPFCFPSLLVQELVFYMHNKHLYVVILSNTFGKHKTNKAKVTVYGRPAGVYIVGFKILWYNIQTLRGSGAYMISLKSSLLRCLLLLWTWAECLSVFLYFDSKAESSSEENGNSDQERVAEMQHERAEILVRDSPIKRLCFSSSLSVPSSMGWNRTQKCSCTLLTGFLWPFTSSFIQ